MQPSPVPIVTPGKWGQKVTRRYVPRGARWTRNARSTRIAPGAEPTTSPEAVMSDPTTTSRESVPPARTEPRRPLEAIFAPRAVAVIGASEKAGSVGRSILWNLIRSPFGGTVYPVNPKRPNVLGIRSYPGIAAVPEQVDL